MSENKITQFAGEDRRDAIVNRFALDIEDEDEFIQYIEGMGYSIDSDDDTLINLHTMWYNKKYNA